MDNMVGEVKLLNAKQIELLSLSDRIKYFRELKSICSAYDIKNKHILKSLLVNKIFPLLRNFNYIEMGMENIPDKNAIYLCNHSNSHDFFTSQEVLSKYNEIKVFAASDDLSHISKIVFDIGGSVLIDRNDQTDIDRGSKEFASNLLNNRSGVIFGESTWNLHPVKEMQKVKYGAARFAALTGTPIIPTIYEYVEVPYVVDKESKLYTKCVVCYGKPIYINNTDSLIDKTNEIQKTMETMRRNLWNMLDINKTTINNVNKEVYINHTYLKKYGAAFYEYDSEYERKYLYPHHEAENEFTLDENGILVPGVIKKLKK